MLSLALAGKQRKAILMGWSGELSQVLLLCAVASREHVARFWKVFSFQYAFASVLQTLYFKRFRGMSVILHFLLQDKLVTVVPSSIVNQESNGSMCDCLCSVS